ncbi:MAG TPA: hypothetical protein VJ834_16880 [Burkholderiales bacterium]|nr:hypothetical protein [Burkholderiales bacterium]
MAKERARNDARSRIAHIAARLMVEDGIEDYALAKRKAARQCRASELRGLPTNEEVDEALREYQNLYGRDEHGIRLKELREKALGAMRELSQFNPHLTGSVLSGSAGKYADIDLQLFTDSVKAVELYLIERGVPYKTAQHRVYSGEHPCTVPVFAFEDGDIPIRIEVFSTVDLRRPLRRTPGGKAVERAKTQAVEALLAQD